MVMALPMIRAPMVMPIFCVNAMKAFAAGMSTVSTVFGVNCHRIEGTQPPTIPARIDSG